MKKFALIVLSSVAMYGQWITGFWSPNNSREPASAIPWSKYTHISHWAALPNSDGTINPLSIYSSDTATLVTNGHAAGKKVLWAITFSSGAEWASATSSGTIANFVNNITNFTNSNGYDGVDLDWEANINVGQFEDLIRRLRAAMPTKVITMDSLEGAPATVAAATQGSLDQVNHMCYDMTGTGTGSAGTSWYNDAIYWAGSAGTSCSIEMGRVVSSGVAPAKLGVGIPFYGYKWSGCTRPLMSCTETSFFTFQDIANDTTRWQPQNQAYDSTYMSNYLSVAATNEFIPYNGVEFMRDAAAWGKAQGFGGYMIFTQDNEYLANQTGDARFPLSTALYSAVFSGATAAPTISTTSLSAGTVGAAYSQTLSGTGSPSWSVVSGSLPGGLSLNSSTAITGTPTTGGTSSFTVQATNGGGSATKALSITINAPAGAAPAISTSSLPAGTVGTGYSQSLTATGTAPITWSLSAGTLPAGLSLNASGAITGTPTTAATSNFTVQAANSAGNATKALSIVISATPQTPASSGPYAYWKLNDGSGSTAADSSGNGKTLSLFNAPTWNSGANCVAGSCLSFNGSNQYGSAALDLSNTSAVTVSFWMNWTAYANDDRLAMEFSSDFNSVATGFMVDPNSSANGGGQFEVGLRGDGGYNQVLFARPSAGWHHYAFVFNKGAAAANEVTPYVDGVAVPYTKTTSSENTNNFGSDTLYLMSRAGSALMGNGALDEVQVYNQPLSASQILTLATANKPPSGNTQAPTVSITSPFANQTVALNSKLTLNVTTSSNIGVASVQYKLDGINLGNPVTAVSGGSFGMIWTATPRGTHTLTAVATDAAGNSTTSAPVTFRVK